MTYQEKGTWIDQEVKGSLEQSEMPKRVQAIKVNKITILYSNISCQIYKLFNYFMV